MTVAPIIIPVSQSAPTSKVYTFEADTEHGGVATISVKVPVSASEEYALREAETILRPGVALRTPAPSQMTLASTYGVLAILLLLGGVVTMLLTVLLDAADILNTMGFNPVRWADWIPIIGGTRFGTGLLRLYMLAWMAWLVVPYYLHKRHQANDAAAAM